MADTTKERLEEWRRRVDAAVHAGSQLAVEKQHERGKLTARERLDLLLDEGSFCETDRLAVHRATEFGMAERTVPGDGVVTGHGTIDGRIVCVFSQDFTVLGGSLGEVYAEKIVKIMDAAIRMGVPLIGINDSGGARIQEGVVALGGYGDIFFRNVQASGVIPQISAIMGPCAGGAVYSPAMTDFVFMVRETSHMFITGPEVIKTVTGEDVTFEDLGGASSHSTRSGVAHFAADDEEQCLDDIRVLLSFLPSNNLDDPPAYDSVDDPERIDQELDTFMPDSPNVPYDMRKVITRIVDRDAVHGTVDGDEGAFMEVSEHFATNIVVGFARLDGTTVGVVGNQPLSLAGVLDVSASEKAARFVRTCDAFNIPIVTFVDVPGFLPGTSQEWGGIIRSGAKLLYAYCEATVPKLTVITRKSYGGAYDVMGSKHGGADVNLAWPTAEIAVMGAEGAVNILYRREIAEAEDPQARRAALLEHYRDALLNPWKAAERGYVDDVIAPSQTRATLIRALRFTRTKRQSRPPRKHGNIPL